MGRFTMSVPEHWWSWFVVVSLPMCLLIVKKVFGNAGKEHCVELS